MLNHLLRLVHPGTAISDPPRPREPGIEPLPDASAEAVPVPSYLTRHPILDARYRLMGYELGVRDRVPFPAMPGAETLQQMKDELLLVSVIDLDYQNALGHYLTLLNLAPTTLFNSLVEQIPRGKVILRVTADEGHPEVAARCAELAAKGIALMLDDAPGRSPSPLLPYCRFVRLDCGRHDMFALIDRISGLMSLGAPQLIAANVATEDVFDACRRLPFTLFQGAFVTSPHPRRGASLDPGRLRVTELLNLVIGRHDIAEIEDRFKRDAALTYRLLRYINAPVNGISQPVQSIGHAIMLLGYDQLYRWLTLMLFTGGKPEGRNEALLRNALVRARFMENLGAGRLKPGEKGGLFAVGILSQLDALLDQPLPDALAPLNLHPSMNDALLRQTGPYAPYLELATACEGFDQDTVRRISAAQELDDNTVNLAHVNALIWSAALEL